MLINKYIYIILIIYFTICHAYSSEDLYQRPVLYMKSADYLINNWHDYINDRVVIYGYLIDVSTDESISHYILLPNETYSKFNNGYKLSNGIAIDSVENENDNEENMKKCLNRYVEITGIVSKYRLSPNLPSMTNIEKITIIEDIDGLTFCYPILSFEK